MSDEIKRCAALYVLSELRYGPKPITKITSFYHARRLNQRGFIDPDATVKGERTWRLTNEGRTYLDTRGEPHG